MVIKDYSIQFRGGADSSRIDEAGARDAPPISQTAYERAHMNANPPRELVRRSIGCNDDAGANFLLASLTQRFVTELQGVRNSADRLGTVCISGYSKGSIYAIRLDQELRDAGIAVRYLGISDLPIFPYGYNPAIPSFPSMIPSNSPVPITTRFDIPLRSVNAPKTTSPTGLGAKVKRNYFQHGGNGCGVKRHPHDLVPYGWWWSSGMRNEEVHGHLTGNGWDNIEVESVGLNDSSKHDKGDVIGIGRIGTDIQAELASP